MSTPILVHLSEYLCEMYHFYWCYPSNFKNSILFVMKFMNFSYNHRSHQMNWYLLYTLSHHIFKISTGGWHTCGACSQLRLSFTALSMAFSGKEHQISQRASVNLGTVLASVAACNKTPAFPPKSDNPVDWGRMNWGPPIIGDEVMAIWLDETWNWKR